MSRIGREVWNGRLLIVATFGLAATSRQSDTQNTQRHPYRESLSPSIILVMQK